MCNVSSAAFPLRGMFRGFARHAEANELWPLRLVTRQRGPRGPILVHDWNRQFDRGSAIGRFQERGEKET